MINQVNAAALCGLKNGANYINAGALFVDPTTHNLEMCTNTGAAVAGATITFGETCFNRFCSYSDPAGSCNPTPCPQGYIQALTVGKDTFPTTVGTPNYYVSSITCCSCTDSTCVKNSFIAPP